MSGSKDSKLYACFNVGSTAGRQVKDIERVADWCRLEDSCISNEDTP